MYIHNDFQFLATQRPNYEFREWELSISSSGTDSLRFFCLIRKEKEKVEIRMRIHLFSTSLPLFCVFKIYVTRNIKQKNTFNCNDSFKLFYENKQCSLLSIQNNNPGKQINK